MENLDYIPPVVGIPLAAVLWGVWFYLVHRERKGKGADGEQ